MPKNLREQFVATLQAFSQDDNRRSTSGDREGGADT